MEKGKKFYKIVKETSTTLNGKKLFRIHRETPFRNIENIFTKSKECYVFIKVKWRPLPFSERQRPPFEIEKAKRLSRTYKG